MRLTWWLVGLENKDKPIRIGVEIAAPSGKVIEVITFPTNTNSLLRARVAGSVVVNEFARTRGTLTWIGYDEGRSEEQAAH